MPRAIHISDVHAGREDRRIVQELLLDIAAMEPDVVVVGGDFTQRARTSQWRTAAGWLERIDAPWIATPGNHDMPLYAFPKRIRAPFASYREWISGDLEPELEVAGIRCLAVKTAAPQRRVEGAVSERSMQLLADRLSQPTSADWTLIVTHHPLAAHPDALPGNPSQGWERVQKIAAAGGVDLLLSGHTHRRRSGPFSIEVGGRSIVVAHSGTACSTRQRGDELQSWQAIDLEGDEMVITGRLWSDSAKRFEYGPESVWERGPSGWSRRSVGA